MNDPRTLAPIPSHANGFFQVGRRLSPDRCPTCRTPSVSLCVTAQGVERACERCARSWPVEGGR